MNRGGEKAELYSFFTLEKVAEYPSYGGWVSTRGKSEQVLHENQ